MSAQKRLAVFVAAVLLCCLGDLPVVHARQATLPPELEARPASPEKTVKKPPQRAMAYGTLVVNVEPSGAWIKVLTVGPKYRRGMSLPAGTHKVQAGKPGYGTQVKYVKIRAGKQSTLTITLAKRSVAPPPPATAAKPPPPAPQSWHAAVAHSKTTKRYAITKNHPSKAAAERAAIQSCGGGDCRSIAWVKNGCVSIAANQRGDAFANWGRDAREAQDKTMRLCKGKGCRIIDTACTAR